MIVVADAVAVVLVVVVVVVVCCGGGGGGGGGGGERRMTTDVYCIFACLNGRNCAFKMLKHHPPEPQNCHLKSPETDASGNFLKPF